MADGTHQRGNLLRRGVLRKIVERDVFALGDRQHMSRALRADVVESEDVRILVDLVAGDLASQDAGEDIVAVVGHRFASAMGSEFGAGALFSDAGNAFPTGQFRCYGRRGNAGSRP